MTDTPDAQPPHAPPITVLEVQGEERIPHRCFTPDVLREIDASLREGPFDKVEWEITDQQGVHTSTDLDALLKNLLWPSVENFELSCSRHFDEPDQRVRFPASVPSSYVRVTTHYSRMVVRWSSAPQNRQPVEFTFLRLLDLLRRLPASRASNPAFVESLPVEPLPVEAPPVESLPVASLPEEPTKAWWNLLRAPRSILDWVGIGLLVAAVVALAGAAVALLARTL